MINYNLFLYTVTPIVLILICYSLIAYEIFKISKRNEIELLSSDEIKQKLKELESK